tara:strand:+ start:84 stop:275 length:192 start_codon:yes stop_codon:yes gene_type:complete
VLLVDQDQVIPLLLFLLKVIQEETLIQQLKLTKVLAEVELLAQDQVMVQVPLQKLVLVELVVL